MSVGERFVRKVLTDKSSAVFRVFTNKGVVQLEYKVKKSPAAQSLLLLEKGFIQVPRWIVYFTLISLVFLITFFSASLFVLGNSKPDAIYLQSCSDRQCSSALGLKCINKTCQCESPKYYKKKCLDLSKYDESCITTSNCEPSQVLTCIGSICKCEFNMYWDSSVSMCVDRLTYGDKCTGDQCKIKVDMKCGSSGTCECTDPTTMTWSDSYQSCIPKRKYSQTCESDNQCQDSQLTICKNNNNNLYCLCTDTKYFDGVSCLDRVGEFVTCTIDDMCLMPMYCSSSTGCTCDPYYFYDSLSSTCVAQYTYNSGPCTTNHNCRSDLHLICDTISSLCVCDSTKYTYSTSDSACKLTYVKGTCTTDTDCNSSEDLICSTGTDVCTCPTATTSGNCDCIRISGNEKYWDSSSNKCVAAKTLNGTCTSNYMCQTKTLNLECNSTTGLCECPQPGGMLTTGTCRKCNTGEVFFNDVCYYFSPLGETCEANQIATKCAAKGGKAAIFDTVAKLTFASLNTNLNEKFWIAGQKKNQGVGGSNTYTWAPTNSNLDIDLNVCNITVDNDCLIYVRDAINCFNGGESCGRNNRFICQR